MDPRLPQKPPEPADKLDAIASEFKDRALSSTTGGKDRVPIPDRGPYFYKEKLIHKILARALITRPREYPRWPASHSSGVIPFQIEGRFASERERLGPDFAEIDRQWRIKWIQDQHLHPSEPRYVPEWEREFFNPIRRMYRAPLTWVETKILAPRMVSLLESFPRSFIYLLIV